ncbi:hypothetical protein HDU90_008350 [Geranomyces variabilis]|nr:hypothetical protein HDU90_008350 [Geranomyces variabilis]
MSSEVFRRRYENIKTFQSTHDQTTRRRATAKGQRPAPEITQIITTVVPNFDLDISSS